MIFIQTYTGLTFDLQNPTPEMVDVEDIAHALSMLCRFTGHTKEFYSVAQHSVLCALKAPAHLSMQALLHDAHEAYVGDLNSPLKSIIGTRYSNLSSSIQRVIDTKFNAEHDRESQHVIRNIDLRMLITEANALLAPRSTPWSIKVDPYDDLNIEPWLPKEAKTSFLSLFSLYKIRQYFETSLTKCVDTNANTN